MKILITILIAFSLVSCTQWDKEEKDYAKKYDAQFKYKEGDVIYLKPDSVMGVITDKTAWSKDRIEYRVRYSTKTGKVEYLDIHEPSIFSKK
jgi:hypothetical protein